MHAHPEHDTITIDQARVYPVDLVALGHPNGSGTVSRAYPLDILPDLSSWRFEFYSATASGKRIHSRNLSWGGSQLNIADAFQLDRHKITPRLID